MTPIRRVVATGATKATPSVLGHLQATTALPALAQLGSFARRVVGSASNVSPISQDTLPSVPLHMSGKKFLKTIKQGLSVAYVVLGAIVGVCNLG